MSALEMEAQNNLDIDESGDKMVDEGGKDSMGSPAGYSETIGKHRKHKKVSRQNSKENVSTPNFVHGPRSWKNSRRSRNGYGRGLPKKGIYLENTTKYLNLMHKHTV